jgi:hypothetical protein
MISNWKRQLLEEASSIFEKGGEASKANESQQSQIDELYRLLPIGNQHAASCYRSRKNHLPG